MKLSPGGLLDGEKFCNHAKYNKRPYSSVCTTSTGTMSLLVWHVPSGFIAFSTYRPGVIVCTVRTDLVSLCVQCIKTWCHCVYSAYRPGVIVCTVRTDLVSLCVQCI